MQACLLSYINIRKILQLLNGRIVPDPTALTRSTSVSTQTIPNDPVALRVIRIRGANIGNFPVCLSQLCALPWRCTAPWPYRRMTIMSAEFPCTVHASSSAYGGISPSISPASLAGGSVPDPACRVFPPPDFAGQAPPRHPLQPPDDRRRPPIEPDPVECCARSIWIHLGRHRKRPCAL